MKNEIENTIKYLQKGKEKEIKIKIKLASQSVVEKYAEFIDSMVLFDRKRQELKVIIENMGSAMVDDDLNFNEKREKIKELESEKKEKEKELLEYGQNTILKDRFKILKKLLEKNLDPDDYTEDDYNMLLNEDFWNEDVDPSDLNNFMNDNILKDVKKNL